MGLPDKDRPGHIDSLGSAMAGAWARKTHPTDAQTALDEC